MTGPRSPRGRKAKGNLGERTMKLRLQNLGHTVLDGRMTEPAVDLILLCCRQLVEVKTYRWNAMPSPVRRACAQAGDLWRSRGYHHFIVCEALEAKPLVLTAGMRENRASMLYKPSNLLTASCSTPRDTVGEHGTVASAQE